MSISAPNYLNPDLPSNLSKVKIPLLKATAQNLNGFGCLVDNYADFKIEIVRWPAAGWRPVDPDTGDEGGVTEGVFISDWKGDILYGKNAAVGGHYILGYSADPEKASESSQSVPNQILLWHANYHPDGGQLFFPKSKTPFVVPLALPGDDVKPEDFVCFWFDGSQGLYIHPNIWHEGVFSLNGTMEFDDRQGAVHARVSVDFAREFNCLLQIDLGESARF